MAIDIWIAGIGILFIYKLKKLYNNKTSTTKPIIKPLYIYKNKKTQNIPIPNMNMFTNSFDDNTYNYNSFIKTRSKSLPVIYEDKSL